MTAGLLRLHHLRVSLRRGRRLLPVLDALDLNLDRGELLALVGESGSGKTTAALAVLRLLPAGATQSGHILLDGTELPGLGAQAMRQRRGRDIGMVFQNTAAALNPSPPVGRQIAEAYRLQTRASAQAGRTHALALLGEVGIVNPAARIDDVPHQFSGGMRQRVMIALALACSPSLLIADEPTSGLDPATARQTLALMARLRRERRMGVLCITHDLSMVADHADRVQVLYAGRTMEHGPAPAVFTAPRHPYSRALLAAVPRSGAARLASIHGSPPDPEHWSEICRFAPRCPDRQDDCTRLPPAGHAAATTAFCLHPGAAPAIAAIHPIIPRAATPDVILRVTDLSVAYPGTTLLARDPRIALHGVSFDLHRGECLGVVGPSGSGKSSLGRAVLQMLPYRGRMALDGQDFASLSKPAFRAQRRRIQAVFQDPAGSLNPHLGIAASIAEPLLLAGVTGATHRRRQVDALLDRVGLPASIGDARPRDLSGGQVQRAAIARALAAKADILVLDEPTSALDVSTQALLLNLLADLQASQTLSYLLISHDHAMVQFLAHRVVKLPWQASEQGQGALPPGLLPRLPHRHGAKRRSTPDNRNSPSSREKFAL